MTLENFEKLNNDTVEFENNQQIEEEKLKLREFYFHEIVISKIVDTYEKQMTDIGFTTEQINEFREKIINLSPAKREALYAFPWELKRRALPSFFQKIKEGKESIETMADKIIEASMLKHRKIAFHASNEDIQPKIERSHGQSVESWVVYGKEKDHRDNDLPMAYYSFDYDNLYRVKNPNYIYIVSMQENEKSGHRKDGNNEWGRAPSLTIIEKIDLKEVDTLVANMVKDEMKKTAANSMNSLAA